MPGKHSFAGEETEVQGGWRQGAEEHAPTSVPCVAMRPPVPAVASASERPLHPPAGLECALHVDRLLCCHPSCCHQLGVWGLPSR